MSIQVTEQAVRRPGRPRSEEADRAIIDTTLDLLVEVGAAAMSIEQIAERAGVGKATVYRRWKNKGDLIVDALATLMEPLPELPGRSLREDLILVVDSIRRRSENSRVGKLFPCMLAEGERFPKMRDRYHEVV